MSNFTFQKKFPMIFNLNTPEQDIEESVTKLQHWIDQICDQHSKFETQSEIEEIVKTELDGILITALTESIDLQNYVEFEHILKGWRTFANCIGNIFHWTSAHWKFTYKDV